MKGKWFAFGCLTSIVLLIVIIISSIISLGKMSKSFSKDKVEQIEHGSYLLLNLNRQITDYSQYKGGFLFEEGLIAHEIIAKIKKSAEDKKIDGIILFPSTMGCGYATLNEIEKALKDFKTSGKKVISYLEYGANKSYLLASCADEIYMNPSASTGIFLSGIGGEILFYKDLFDKLGIDIFLLNAGDYKGAYENYTRRSFSEPVKRNVTAVYKQLYKKMLEKISENRNLSNQELKYIFEERDKLFLSGADAKKIGLVDETMFWNELKDKFKLTEGKLIEVSDYPMPNQKTKSNKIALIYAQGIIIPESFMQTGDIISAKNISDIVDKIEKDDNIKGVILRINSPGGSAFESEKIHGLLSRFNGKKPFLVSMGNVAASGGYYIASGADYIMADPACITGSIGVAAMLPNLKKLTDKIGISSDEIGVGEFYNFLSLYQKPDQKKILMLKNQIEETYLEFKTRVADGRSLSLEEVEKIAQGQIWSGEKAVELGLVDEVGMLEDAVAKIAEMANLEDFSLVYFPKRKSFIEKIIAERFNFEVKQELIPDELSKDLDLEKIKQIYQLAKTDPILTLLPLELDK